MQSLAFLISAAVSGVLLWAGLEKLRLRADFDATLTALGIPAGLRILLWVGLVCGELGTGTGLVVLPSAVWPRLGLVILGAMFAVGGVLGMRADHPVACSCLGAASHGPLGWRQIELLPVWLAAAAALQWLHHPAQRWQRDLQYLAGLVVVMGAIRAAAVVRAWRLAAGDRVALAEAMAQPAPMFKGTRGMA
jgi:hypothetical protein